MHAISTFYYNHYILCSLWILILLVIIFNIFKSVFFEFETISNYETIQLINKNCAVIVDLRDENEFFSGHIINSLNITPHSITYNLSNDLNKIPKNKFLILVCKNGSVPYWIMKKILKYKFKKIYVMKEGILGWKRECLPLIKIKNDNKNY